ncbi:hypothetical protein Peur_017873 [Populus x canadensis]
MTKLAFINVFSHLPKVENTEAILVSLVVAKTRFHSSHQIQIPLLPPQSELPITATCKPILAIKP